MHGAALLLLLLLGGGRGGTAASSAEEALLPIKLTRVLLNDTASSGAVCLDGTPGGWFERVLPPDHPNATKFHLHIQGGGWGIGFHALLGRIQGRTGTSAIWPADMGDGGGLLSSDPAVNPITGGWNILYLQYCDGGSFTGDRDEPIDVNGTKLYFRGRRILREMITSLLATRGMAAATEVLISGGSAGGLSAYLHANYISRRLPASATVAVVPLSGFFLESPDAGGAVTVVDRFRWLFETHNSTAAVEQSNPRCLFDNRGAEHLCLFAPRVLKYAERPTFVVNSIYDSYQLPGILMLHLDPGWAESVTPGGFANREATSICAGYEDCQGGIHQNKSLFRCNSSQMHRINVYRELMLTQANLSGIEDPAVRERSGCFLHSCVNHVEADNSADWSAYTVDGVVMRDAIREWHSDLQRSITTANAHDYDRLIGQVQAGHVWTGCRYTAKYPAGQQPAPCNPTCAV